MLNVLSEHSFKNPTVCVKEHCTKIDDIAVFFVFFFQANIVLMSTLREIQT